MKRLILMVACAAMLAGCVSANVGGNLDKINPEYARAHLIKGKTTKADVRRLFGEPPPAYSSIRSNGTEDWVYFAESGTNMLDAASTLIPVAGVSTAADIASRAQAPRRYTMLNIYFDKNGLVESWSL